MAAMALCDLPSHYLSNSVFYLSPSWFSWAKLTFCCPHTHHTCDCGGCSTYQFYLHIHRVPSTLSSGLCSNVTSLGKNH